MTFLTNMLTWHGQRRALEVSLFLLFIHFIGTSCLWLSREFRPSLGEASSKLGVITSFLPISLLLVIGLSLRFHVFYSLGLPNMHSAVSSVIFCLDFSPFFFLLLFPCWVFFLYLSTYSHVSCHTSMYAVILCPN